MKHLEPYNEINTSTDSDSVAHKINNDRDLCTYISIYLIGDIFFENMSAYSNSEFWTKSDKYYKFVIKFKFVDVEVFENFQHFCEVFNIPKSVISPITERRVGTYFSVHEDDMVELLTSLKELSTVESVKKILSENIIYMETLLKKLKYDQAVSDYNL